MSKIEKKQSEGIKKFSFQDAVKHLLETTNEPLEAPPIQEIKVENVGGTPKIIVPGIAQTYDTLPVIVLGYAETRVFYPEHFSKTAPGTRPDCYSDNREIPTGGENMLPGPCKGCPKAEFNTGITEDGMNNGDGCACKAYDRFALIVPGLNGIYYIKAGPGMQKDKHNQVKIIKIFKNAASATYPMGENPSIFHFLGKIKVETGTTKKGMSYAAWRFDFDVKDTLLKPEIYQNEQMKKTASYVNPDINLDDIEEVGYTIVSELPKLHKAAYEFFDRSVESNESELTVIDAEVNEAIEDDAEVNEAIEDDEIF